MKTLAATMTREETSRILGNMVSECCLLRYMGLLEMTGITRAGPTGCTKGNLRGGLSLQVESKRG